MSKSSFDDRKKSSLNIIKENFKQLGEKELVICLSLFEYIKRSEDEERLQDLMSVLYTVASKLIFEDEDGGEDCDEDEPESCQGGCSCKCESGCGEDLYHKILGRISTLESRVEILIRILGKPS